MAWINKDGLRIAYASEEAVNNPLGEYGNYDPGSIHLLQLDINPESLDTVGKKTWYSCRLPGTDGKVCYIKAAEIHVETAFTGGGTLTIGFDNVDGTVFDADGIDATVAYTAMTAGTEIKCDGALVNTRLANDQALHLTTTVATAVPATGKGWVKIWYYLTNE